MSANDPQWELLPHDPEGFFELESGFQRADLKRSYNKLLRRFKPEKSPAEFQTIRAAYEQLDTRLRYGVETQPAQVSAFPSSPSVESSTIASDQTAKSLRAKIQTLHPKEVYAELKAKGKKSPRDYFALAVLSDLCDSKGQQMFLKWLLTGIKEFPKEPALFQLLQNLFQSEMSPKLAMQVLPMLAGILKNDSFFILTEPLWLDLLAKLPFASFQKLLEKCDQQLKGHLIRGKTIFCLQLLRVAIFRAPGGWLRSIARFVEDNHDQVPEYLEFDYEITMALLKYRHQSKEFCSVHPLRTVIHKAFSDYCSLDENAGAQSVMECHSSLSQRVNELLDAFPIDDERDWSDMLDAWRWVSMDVARRVWMEPEEPDMQQLVEIVAMNVQQAETSQGRTFWTRINYGKIGNHVLIVSMILIGIPWLIAGFLPEGPVVNTIMFAIRLIGMIGYGIMFKRVGEWSDTRTKEKLHRSYEDRWRPIMARMLSGTNGNLNAVCHVLNYLVEESDFQTNVAPYLLAFASRDFGLQVFSDSQMFVK